MKTGNSLDWYSNRSVGAEVLRGNIGKIDNDIDVKYRSGNCEGVG